jgi:hypothetical protein
VKVRRVTVNKTIVCGVKNFLTMLESSETDFMVGRGRSHGKVLDKYLARGTPVLSASFEWMRRHRDLEGKLIKMIEHHDIVINNDSLWKENSTLEQNHN